MLGSCGSGGEGERKGCTFPGVRVVEVSSNGWRWNAGWEGTPMLTVVPDPASRDNSPAGGSVIDEIVREGARRVLAEALQAGGEAYIAAFPSQRHPAARPLVGRHAHPQPR